MQLCLINECQGLAYLNFFPLCWPKLLKSNHLYLILLNLYEFNKNILFFLKNIKNILFIYLLLKIIYLFSFPYPPPPPAFPLATTSPLKTVFILPSLFPLSLLPFIPFLFLFIFHPPLASPPSFPASPFFSFWGGDLGEGKYCFSQLPNFYSIP